MSSIRVTSFCVAVWQPLDAKRYFWAVRDATDLFIRPVSAAHDGANGADGKGRRVHSAKQKGIALHCIASHRIASRPRVVAVHTPFGTPPCSECSILLLCSVWLYRCLPLPEAPPPPFCRGSAPCTHPAIQAQMTGAGGVGLACDKQA